MRILIVDDTEEYHDLLKAFLPKVVPAAELSHASSGQYAIEMLSNGEVFDLIISDYAMVSGTGADVFRYLKSVALRIPFILFTAFASPRLADFVGDNFMGIVDKPDLARLKALVLRAATVKRLVPADRKP